MGSDLVRRGDRLDDEAAVGIDVCWKILFNFEVVVLVEWSLWSNSGTLRSRHLLVFWSIKDNWVDIWNRNTYHILGVSFN